MTWQVHNSPGVRIKGGISVIQIIEPRREKGLRSPKEKQADTGREDSPAARENDI